MRTKGAMFVAIYFLLLLFNPGDLFAQAFTRQEIEEWERRAKDITIIRDKWGIPHIYGKSDADAVFGLLYAQCEDDFERVEMNYVSAMGRLAEVQGEEQLFTDLRTRLYNDTLKAKAMYDSSPRWLKKL